MWYSRRLIVYAGEETPWEHKKEKRGGVWYSHRLVISAGGGEPSETKKKRNEVACGIHATSLSTPGKETPRKYKKEEKRDGVWNSHRLVIFPVGREPSGAVKKKKRGDAACGIHAASCPCHGNEPGRRG